MEPQKAINRLQRQLDRAINDSLYFLGRYSSQALLDIIDFIEDELGSIEGLDNECHRDDVDGVTLIEQLRFIETTPDVIEIPDDLGLRKRRDLNAVFALFRAIEGKHYLEVENNYVSAAESCTDAFEALYSVFSLPERVKIDKRSLRGKKGKQSQIDNVIDDRKTVIAEVEYIVNNIDKFEDHVFRKKNGSWHFGNISDYILEKLVNKKIELGKKSLVNIGYDTIKETVTLSLKNSAKISAILEHQLLK